MKRLALALILAAAGCGSDPADATLASRQAVSRSIHCAGNLEGPRAGTFTYDLTVWASGSAMASASVDAGADDGTASVTVAPGGRINRPVELEVGDAEVWTFEYEPAPSRLADPKPNVLLITNSDAPLGSVTLTRKSEMVIEGCEVAQ